MNHAIQLAGKNNGMKAEIHYLESLDHFEWSEYENAHSLDPYDDYGWFHVTIGATDVLGGNDFQVCVATPRAVGRLKQSGIFPGVIVDRFDARCVEQAIGERVEAISGDNWNDIVWRLREFMKWEYEGMG